jgi:hypothetical protein
MDTASNKSRIVAGMAVAAASLAAHGETISFDTDPPGALPASWVSGVTGRGAPRWSVEADATAPSALQVLKQSGNGTVTR